MEVTTLERKIEIIHSLPIHERLSQMYIWVKYENITLSEFKILSNEANNSYIH